MNGAPNMRRRTANWSTWAVTGGGAILVCLVMATSSAAAAGITYSAPWKTALVKQYGDEVVTSCGTVAGAKTTSFSKKTGVATWSGSTSAKPCKGALAVLFGEEAFFDSGVSISQPVRVAAGTHTATFNVSWDVNAVANATMTPSGTCPAAVYNATLGYGYSLCLVESSASVEIFAGLVDLTTGQTVYSSYYEPVYQEAYLENYTYCSGPSSCSYYNYSSPGGASTTSTSVNAVFSSTTTSADHYAIFTWEEVELDELFITLHGTGAASLNMKTGGNGAKLVSISET